jgi:mono/diheme cytochrome c family protein
MKKVLKVTLFIIAFLFVAAVGVGFYVKKALPNVGPPADLTVQVTPARLERGRYLCTSVAGCMVCHSSRDTGLFAGPVIVGTLGKGGEYFGPEEGLPGKIYAGNLTPYNLQHWTDGELFRVITTGVSKDGHALFPLMNYPAYGRLDQEDILSMIAYLRTLPSIANDVPATQLNFPMSLIVNTIPAKATLAARPDSNDAVAYGKYLVTMASCVDCHSQVDKGRIVAGMEFGGGRDFHDAGGRTVYSRNITPDKETGIGSWSRELFVRKFKLYADSGYIPQPVRAGQLNTPMPWLAFAGMRESDLAAIYAYLRTVKPIHNEVPAGMH